MDCTVSRERDRVDVLIEGRGHAIIIENKINDAVDQPRQLAGYYTTITQRRKVDAVVYLSKSGQKSPTYENWTQDEIDAITQPLILVGAYNGLPDDLVEGWLKICETKAQRIDSMNVIRSYRKLLYKMGTEIINHEMYNDFYNKVLDKRVYSDAYEIKNIMTNKLAYLISAKIISRFEQSPHPFKQVIPADDTTVFIDWYIGPYSIVLQCSYYHDKSINSNFDIRIFERRNKDFPQSVLNLLVGKYEFKELKPNGYYKYFIFPDNFSEHAEDPYDFFCTLDQLLKDLSEIKILA